VEIPDVRYARSGDVAIAYEVVGDGPIDIVFARGFAGELLSMWEYPYLVWFIEQLETFSRVIMLDKRGTGLSDRVRVVPTLETRMDDLRAVMDAVESERALLWTAQEGARLATLFAATYPERTAGLFLFDPTARGRRAGSPSCRRDGSASSAHSSARSGRRSPPSSPPRRCRSTRSGSVRRSTSC